MIMNTQSQISETITDHTPVIVDAIRTPIAKADSANGYFRDMRADELSAHVMRELVKRADIDPNMIEDVVWGCVQQQGEQGFDIARIALLMADLPVTVGGVTVHRNCASSLTAVNQAAMAIASGFEDIQIAGGVEHMDHVPMTEGYDPSPRLFQKHSEASMNMGLTAEYLTAKYKISRDMQDDWAAHSHAMAYRATESGHFHQEILPTPGSVGAGMQQDMEDSDIATLIKHNVTIDQCIRPDTSAASLAKLSPVFNPAGGSVTAGNSSPLSVGACGVMMMSLGKARSLGIRPLAKVKSMAVAGVDPSEMGIGPVPATGKALSRAGLSLDDIGAIELNEAFAAQVLSVFKLWGMDVKEAKDKVNTRGGAIAIGHPLGASGARILTTLLYRMLDEDHRYGLATLCVGQGQGVATVLEKI